MDNNKVRDEYGKYAKKGLYLTETCRKCKYIEKCEGVIASKGSKVIVCPKRSKFKSEEKRKKVE